MEKAANAMSNLTFDSCYDEGQINFEGELLLK